MNTNFHEGDFVRLHADYRIHVLEIGVHKFWDGLQPLEIDKLFLDDDGDLMAEVVLPTHPKDDEEMDTMTIQVRALELAERPVADLKTPTRH